MTTVNTGPYGPFTYTVATGTWWWADDLYRIHGFEPGDIVPTTELLVAHKHPDDSVAAEAVITAAFVSGEPFALWHRILDARRRVRQVVSVGDGVRDAGGTLVEVRGFMVDVTDSKRSQTARDIDEAVRRSAQSRATIEQAKGVIMAALGVDDAAAFALLKRGSQRANVKLRDLAEIMLRSLADMRSRGGGAREVVQQLFAPDLGAARGRDVEVSG